MILGAGLGEGYSSYRILESSLEVDLKVKSIEQVYFLNLYNWCKIIKLFH